MFVVPCAVDYVGAIIDRPAHKCCEFARTDAKTQHFPARALDKRPYIHAGSSCDKLKPERGTEKGVFCNTPFVSYAVRFWIQLPFFSI